ncbi:hypothetical protein H2684_09035 [Clostridium sp. cel8]|jgi:tryptophanyl-tRNA synthetase|uniref:hypothetical protein n=1 Tax=unclassified Clostridium TaxID=2614128 RepID=UPI0015F76D00|nr:hypothetical protein [Clostridium sp. cel8]MBA5851449.1 hypothetical protein [Clostridium sp. cel8]
MSHKKKSKSKEEIENQDLGYYENKVNSLKKTVKQLEKIKKRRKEVQELERKKRRIMKKMKKRH